jgi:uncharacterized membrane protein
MAMNIKHGGNEMPYLFLALAMVTGSAQTIGTKQYNVKAKHKNQYLYSAMMIAFAMLVFFIIAKFKFEFSASFLPYALAFGISYLCAILCSSFAISCGPLSLTSLFISFSMLIPALYGIIFLGDDMTVFFYVGLVLLVISLILINAKNETVKITPKWIILVSIAFVSNGMCSVFQTMQQRACGGKYKSEFMICALAIAFVTLFVIGMTVSRERIRELRSCISFAAVSGSSNAALNYFIMILQGMLSPAILFPSYSAGAMLIMYVVSRFIYREKLSIVQSVGYAVAVASIVFLNL